MAYFGNLLYTFISMKQTTLKEIIGKRARSLTSYSQRPYSSEFEKIDEGQEKTINFLFSGTYCLP